MAITRGATITNIFNVEVDLTTAVVMYVTFSQCDRVIVEKTLEDCTVETDKITVYFSQEDTLKFEEKLPVEIQIRARLSSGAAPVSCIIRTYATELLKEGVI